MPHHSLFQPLQSHQATCNFPLWDNVKNLLFCCMRGVPITDKKPDNGQGNNLNASLTPLEVVRNYTDNAQIVIHYSKLVESCIFTWLSDNWWHFLLAPRWCRVVTCLSWSDDDRRCDLKGKRRKNKCSSFFPSTTFPCGAIWVWKLIFCLSTVLIQPCFLHFGNFLTKGVFVNSQQTAKKKCVQHNFWQENINN